MEGSGKLETTLCPHGFILSIMKGMESQVLYFLVVLIIKYISIILFKHVNPEIFTSCFFFRETA